MRMKATRRLLGRFGLTMAFVLSASGQAGQQRLSTTDAGANRFVQPVEMAELTSFTAYPGLEKQVPSLPELRTESNRRSE